MLEIFYLYGVMLLLLDRLIPSIVRERLVICYCRYVGQNASEQFQKVCKLVKATGYHYDKETRKETLPKHYPVDYFKRFFVDKKLVEQLINQLKESDIYHRISAYPDPEDRSAALADQAQINFVLLNFVPKLLEKEDAKMREIIDRHFPDNWIIPIFQGHLVDLTEYWKEFGAANKAMANNIYMDNIKKMASGYYKKMKKCQEALKAYLIEGKLLEEYVLDHVKSLMKLLRDINVTIRWVTLHKTSKN